MNSFYKLFVSLLIISFSTCNSQNTLVLNGADIILNGGTATNNIYLVVDQPNPSGIIRLSKGGHIHSENQYNYVKWRSGLSTGSYVFPFGIAGNPSEYIPFTFNKTSGNGSISTSTWATNQQNVPHPKATNVSAVTNMLGITDSVKFALDRFWDIQAISTTADLTFSYLGNENTTSTPTALIRAQHWNGNSWDPPIGSGTAGVTTGTGTTGPFVGQNTFSPWVLITDCPSDSVKQNVVICEGSSLTVGANNYTTTGEYVDSLKNILGCDSIIITNLTVSPIAEGTDTQVACGNFTWIDGNTYTIDNNTAKHTIVNGTSNGCDSIVTLNLTIQSPPIVNATSNTPICEGETLQLGATTINGAIYQWIGPNGFSSQDQNPIINNSDMMNDGNYQVIASIENDCADTASIDITVNPLPVLNTSVIDDSCSTNTGTVKIEAFSPNFPLTYLWTSGNTEPNITNLSEGSYEITVTDNVSCSITQSFNIYNNIDDCRCFIYVANAFSPNGDNNNDFIPVRGECVSNLTFKIFNRWGNIVFHTNKLNDGWDGYYKGELQNTGVFVYTLEATFINGETVEKSGDISLIR